MIPVSGCITYSIVSLFFALSPQSMCRRTSPVNALLTTLPTDFFVHRSRVSSCYACPSCFRPEHVMIDLFPNPEHSVMCPGWFGLDDNCILEADLLDAENFVPSVNPPLSSTQTISWSRSSFASCIVPHCYFTLVPLR